MEENTEIPKWELKHNKNQRRVPGEMITEFFVTHTFFYKQKKIT